ncbi:cathepsin O isoform X2 [Aplysia californica]|uniref:Cathepsin O isoform X1 n=1 Tax=Aplysia californica TaxID=6500 RepID=A0ABM1AB44_APLCA|nr:cathepsin O isoform X1 [Aplysia californica]XP_035828636.1 cathepsin O isoform X2 [Aplysia californica]
METAYCSTQSRGVLTMFAFCLVVILLSQTDAMMHCKEKSLTQRFLDFALEQKRAYITNETEFQRRCDIFQANLAHAQVLNKPHNSTIYGVNKFADLSSQEFQDLYLSGYKSARWHKNASDASQYLGSQMVVLPPDGLPQRVDWRDKKVVTPIRDQKACGACWAFSVVETMESMYAIQYNTTPPSLSVQELIDCDDNNKGCEGGDICLATRWAQANGVVSESKYPLTDHTDSCKKVPASVPRVAVDSYNCTSYTGKEKSMLALLASRGPIAVAVDASTWHNYVSGIIQFHCSNLINHAVQIVGYDLTGEIPYYIVRNSWGSDFGDHGYLYIKIGDNLCGLADEVSSLLVKEKTR